jgi:hypothetical protein
LGGSPVSSDPSGNPTLFEKLSELPAEKLAEVEEFVDFLRYEGEDRGLRRAAMKLSEGAFEKAWNNPADAAYDEL